MSGDLDPWMSDVERFVTGSAQARPKRKTSKPTVRIRVLGTFAVEVDGADVPTAAWGSRNARQVCKRLVVNRGRPVTRDEMIDMLWPDEFDRRRLSARLSVQLSAVRRILGGGVIADRQTVRLDLDEVSTDLEEFAAAVDDAAIVAAYGGELLPEDRYEDWVGPSRDEAQTRFVTAGKRRASLAIGHGDFADAARLTVRLIDADRYDEAAHQMRIHALASAGEIGAARHAHAAWAAAMSEIGVDVAPFDEVAPS